MKKSSVKEAVIAVTYRCNSRCRMCGIWKLRDHEGEFSPDDLRNLPKTLTDINISGGEPFLRKDLLEIVKVLSEENPKANIIISSNGFATQLIIDRMKEALEINPRVGVVLSLDGIGKRHDEIRGIENGFAKTMETFRQLKKIGVGNLKFGYTLGDYNFLELKKVYGLTKQLGIEMSFTLVHSSENYFGQDNEIGNAGRLIEQIDWLIAKELRQWDIRRWGRAFYAHGMKKFLETGQRVLPDYSGQLSVFVDPKGDVFPCDVSSRKIGTLKNFERLETALPNECEKSWMMCTARQSIKKHKWQVLRWVFANKIKLHLNMQSRISVKA